MPDQSRVDEQSTPDLVRRRRLVMTAVMMAMFMAAVESTIVATAMPTIVADLGGFRLFSWVFAIFLLTQTVTVPIYGRLADLHGRKRVFCAGAALFLVGSALCGFAWNMIALIAFRALQGLGAGAILPIASTIVGDIYAPADRARVQGYLSGVWGVSAIIGPVLGAFIVQHLSWSVIFWVNMPIGALAIGMIAVFLKERLVPRRHTIDYGGSALLMIGSGTFILALTQAASLGPGALAALLAVAAAALGGLVLNERRSAEPMLRLDLWRIRAIAVSNLGALAIGAVMMGITAFLPAYVQGAMGRSPVVAGFALTVMSIGWSSASAVSGRMMLRTSYRFTATLGGVFLILGSGVLISLRPSYGPLVAGAGAMLIGLGIGLAHTTFLIAIQGSVGWSERGTATSSMLFMRMVGQSIGVAVFAGVFNYVLFGAAPDAAGTIDRLMEPSLRQGLDPAEIARLSGQIAQALRSVYLISLILGAVTLGLTLAYPRGLRPESTASQGQG